MKQDSKPAALLILPLVMMVFLQQTTVEGLWSPAYLGRGLGWSQPDAEETSLYIDTAGLTNLPNLSFLPRSLPHLKPNEFLRVTPSGSEVRKRGRPERGKLQSDLHSGSPRMRVEQRSETFRLSALLHQPKVGTNLFSGPIEGWVDTELYRPLSEGTSLQALALLPRETERALLLDTRGLRLPQALRARLMEQWKRWEFEPYVSLSDALGPSLCYAEWRKQALVLADIKSGEAIGKALQRRFPPKVIRMATAWSYGTTIWGFEKASKPAWMLRGDQFVVTGEGGTERLSQMLKERFERDYSFRPASPMLRELERLAGQQKGWHVCIIEQPSNSNLHWAALVRWPDTETDKVEGALVVWLQVKPTQWEENS